MTIDAPETTKPKRSGPVRVVVETVVLVVVAVVLALIVKTFFVQAFYIPSISMEPGLQINDRILVEKPSYWFGGSPQRGDVIVFADPGGWLDADADAAPASGVGKVLAKVGLYPTGGHLVKRVIGVAGDTVHCCDDQGRVEVNGRPLDEDSFIARQEECDGPMEQSDGTYRGGCRGWTAKVPKGRLFVMGDNRGDSADSSYHLCSPTQQRRAKTSAAMARRCADAYVPTSLVVGKVVALVWPASHFSFLHRPATFSAVPSP
ncbi:signal peptidase I [Nocardioides sp. KR10-350]|uniref:signal peptidase I n=1 Tax=Nocardioides cheoyonin TaxID=3156615 RepID=UPI0032B394B9